MPVVYVIHTEEDRAFVEQQLLRPLPALGFDRWLSRAMCLDARGGEPPVQSAIERSAAVLVVVPASGSVPDLFCDDVRSALTRRSSVIPVYLGTHNTEPPDPVLTMLQSVGGIDAR